MYDFNEAGYLAYSICDRIAKVKNYHANVWTKKWGKYRIYISYNNRTCGYYEIDYWSGKITSNLKLRPKSIRRLISVYIDCSVV